MTVISTHQAFEAGPYLAGLTADARAVLAAAREKKWAELTSAEWLPWLTEALALGAAVAPPTCDFAQGVVRIGEKSDLGAAESERLAAFLRAIMPWKKGPFSLFGHAIDSEWRSDLKWERFLPHVKTLKDQAVCDIGCNNGYFMLRMLALKPEYVLGIDPVVSHWLTCTFLKHVARAPNVYFEPWGVEHMRYLRGQFDTVFCMGILYHHTDPVGLLRQIKKSLKTGGLLFLDCQGIAGEDSVALVPSGRYAGARGIWFLPTKSCLVNWCKRAGFANVDVFYDGALLPEEQRATDWARVKSLADFLDSANTRTVEGYPAPRRFYARVS